MRELSASSNKLVEERRQCREDKDAKVTKEDRHIDDHIKERPSLTENWTIGVHERGKLKICSLLLDTCILERSTPSLLIF